MDHRRTANDIDPDENLKVSIPTDVGNAKIKDGSLPKILKAILDDLKPEAVYFTNSMAQR